MARSVRDMGEETNLLPGRSYRTDISPGARRVGGEGAEYLAPLDGLRAVAILLVVLAHLGLEHRLPGAFGVTLFFFISGWLITRLLRARLARGGGLDLRGFYWRRALRLLPAGLAYILASGLAFGALGGRLGPPSWLAALFYAANYASLYGLSQSSLPGIRHPFSILWSLAIEEQFYMLWPLAFGLLWRPPARARALRVVLAACAAVLAWRAFLFAHCAFLPGSEGGGVCLPVSANALWRYNRLYLATDTRADSLLFGAALAMLPAADGGARRAAWPGALLLAASFALPGDFARYVLRPSLQGLGLFWLFPACLQGRPGRVLAAHGLVWIGRLSYSLYLWHWGAMMLADASAPQGGWRWAAEAALLATALAIASYIVIERPMLRVRRRAGSAVPDHLPR